MNYLRPFHLASASGLNTTVVRSGAGALHGWYLFNTNASASRSVKVYDSASPTVGTTVPAMTLTIPPGAGANVSFPDGISFAHAIAIATTAGPGDSDTTGVAAGEVIVNLIFS